MTNLICFLFAKTFVANTDRYTVVSHDLNPPIRARFLRIVPEEWQTYSALRVEFYGCKTSKITELCFLILFTSPYYTFLSMQQNIFKLVAKETVIIPILLNLVASIHTCFHLFHSLHITTIKVDSHESIMMPHHAKTAT